MHTSQLAQRKPSYIIFTSVLLKNESRALTNILRYLHSNGLLCEDRLLVIHICYHHRHL